MELETTKDSFCCIIFRPHSQCYNGMVLEYASTSSFGQRACHWLPTFFQSFYSITINKLQIHTICFFKSHLF